jgi:Mce-associated membrane protein
MPAKVTSSPVDVADSADGDTVVEDTVVKDTVVEDTATGETTGRAGATVAEPAVDEPAPESAGARSAFMSVWPSRRPSRWTVLVAALSALLVALWVAGALLVVHNRGISQLSTQRQQVLAAAQKVAGDLTSIGADNAPAQIQNLTGESTGAFRDQISTYAQALQTILQQSKAGSRGTVTAAGIESMAPDAASVLVTVSATVSNSRVTASQPVSYRLGVKLQREGDRWLASDVAFVQ